MSGPAGCGTSPCPLPEAFLATSVQCVSLMFGWHVAARFRELGRAHLGAWGQMGGRHSRPLPVSGSVPAAVRARSQTKWALSSGVSGLWGAYGPVPWAGESGGRGGGQGVKFGIGVCLVGPMVLPESGPARGPRRSLAEHRGHYLRGRELAERPLGSPVGEGRLEVGEGSESAPEAPEAPKAPEEEAVQECEARQGLGGCPGRV